MWIKLFAFIPIHICPNLWYRIIFIFGWKLLFVATLVLTTNGSIFSRRKNKNNKPDLIVLPQSTMYIDCNVYICVCVNLLMNNEEAKSFTSACITSTKHKHYKNDTYRGNVNYLWAVRILSHLGSCGVNIISYYSFSPEPQSVLWPAVNTIT